jgi:four helix bundle protein
MAFECLEVAHEAVLSIGAIIACVERRDRSMADQMRRTAVGIVSNIDEGVGNVGARRVQHYRYALGSAREVTSQLRVAMAWGYVADVGAALALLDRVRAMLWRLTR